VRVTTRRRRCRTAWRRPSWSCSAGRCRVPRAGLSRAAVVAAAAELADAGGYERLTLAAVAQQFGVKLPSLYKHVAGVEDLQRGVALLAVRELGAALSAAAVGRSGGDALRAMGLAYRRYALAHPGRYAATVRAPDPQDPDHLAAAEGVTRTLFAVLTGMGIEDGELVHATRTVRSALHGFVALEAAGGFGLPHAVGDSFEHLLGVVERGLCSAADDRGSPAGRPT